jgi:hypothetical protein
MRASLACCGARLQRLPAADPYADVGAHPILAHDITGKNGRSIASS